MAQIDSTSQLRPGGYPGWTSVVNVLGGLGRFARKKPLGAVSGFLILGIIVFAIFAPLLDFQEIGPTKQVLRERLQAPSGEHWFGTDNLGRDVYARLVHGSRSTVYVGFLSVFAGTAVGTILGLVSGYFGGKYDMFIQRVIDSIMAFPPLLLGLAMATAFPPSNNISLLIIALILMPGATRLVRGTTLSLKNYAYVEASRAIGASTYRILSRHILPNTFAPILVLVSVMLGAAILVDASLRFLGAGLPEPDPAWGLMLSGNGRQFLETAPWMAIAPGVAISVNVLAFNLLGDAMRDLLDPRLRGR